jgi:hypothetical protein
MFCKIIFLILLASFSLGEETEVEYIDELPNGNSLESEEIFHYSNNSRIVNGTPINITRVPFFASLLYIRTGSRICGASIISIKWLLSAAHCFVSTMD